jgi:hypothetical protein
LFALLHGDEKEPTDRQLAGAMLIAETIMRARFYLGGK